MESERAERVAFDHYLRTGRRRLPHPIERKFNHNHDPRDGRFTSGAGGGGSGPFQAVATKRGAVGDTARKLNRLATDPAATETLSLFGNNVTIRRTGADGVELSGARGIFHATGRFAMVAGKQAIKISVDDYGLRFPFSKLAEIVSFPSTITLFSHHDDSLGFSIDRALVIKTDVPNGSANITRGAHVLVR